MTELVGLRKGMYVGLEQIILMGLKNLDLNSAFAVETAADGATTDAVRAARGEDAVDAAPALRVSSTYVLGANLALSKTVSVNTLGGGAAAGLVDGNHGVGAAGAASDASA